MNKLTATALITVNLLDENDNAPKFERPKYFIQVLENEKPGVQILKVMLPIHLSNVFVGR